MDSLRFVLEAPQLSQTHKKRRRLVTSCDNCRLEKIVCVQTKSQPRCEACEAGNTPCQFRDRERYFAERSRIVTGASAGSSPAHSQRSQSSQSTEPSAIPPPTRGDPVDASGWYSGTQTSPDHGHPSRYASSSPSYNISSSTQSNPDQWFSSPLVEPARPHYERQSPYDGQGKFARDEKVEDKRSQSATASTQEEQDPYPQPTRSRKSPTTGQSLPAPPSYTSWYGEHGSGSR